MADFRQMRLGAAIPVALNSMAFSNFQIAASNSAVYFIFQPALDNSGDTLVITRLGYRLSAVAGTSPVYKISLQGVDGAGNPDGTVKGGGTPASATFTPAGSNTWNWITLDNAYTAARGEMLAIVIEYSSGTINASNAATVSYGLASPSVETLPYVITNTAGTLGRVNNYPLLGYASASKAYGCPIQSAAATSFSSNSTPDEYAFRFVIDSSFASTYKVAGMRFLMQTTAAGKTYKLILYNGTTPIQTVTMDGDHVTAAGSVRVATVFFDNTNALVALTGGNEYRIGLQPQETANNIALGVVVVTTASDQDAFPGGQQFYESTRTDAGAWTDVMTTRPVAELIIQDWTLTAGGGIAKLAGYSGGLVG